MIWIWGRPMAVDLYDILVDIRSEAKTKLKKDTLVTLQQAGDDIFVTCPNLSGHGGELERTPSCSIHKETGKVHCFGCDYKASLPVMISQILELDSLVAGYRWLLRKYTVPIQGERPTLNLKHIPRDITKTYVDIEALEMYNYYHPYMFQRGLTEEIIDWFDIGYDKKMKAITIPMKDHKGRIVFIKKRPIGRTKFHKYHIEEGVEKKDLVFGLDLIAPRIDRVKMLYLSEGEFDAMSWYAVQKYGAGQQGDRLFEEQAKQLKRLVRGIPICLAYDNDQAGRAATERAIPILKPYFPLYQLMYPRGINSDGKPKYKDPNDLLRAGLLDSCKIVPIR
jgi:DNA primase